ncbi:hypothetical protein WG936_05310 [Corynebacterium sp. H127]|uniref:hypothetical protein n=1 Tax=Corynebacterium sp. H127 TaxID=3133418 RepID=UPI0030A0C695
MIPYLQLQDGLGNIPKSDRAEYRDTLLAMRSTPTLEKVLDNDKDGRCSGWLWQWTQSQPDYKDHYADFTFEKAQSEGLVGK